MDWDMRLEVSGFPSQTIGYAELARRFPEMSLFDLSDLLWMFGIVFKIRVVVIDPFLWDAWKRKAEQERKG